MLWAKMMEYDSTWLILIWLAQKNVSLFFQGQYDIWSVLWYASNKEKESHPGSIKLKLV